MRASSRSIRATGTSDRNVLRFGIVMLFYNVYYSVMNDAMISPFGHRSMYTGHLRGLYMYTACIWKQTVNVNAHLSFVRDENIPIRLFFNVMKWSVLNGLGRTIYLVAFFTLDSFFAERRAPLAFTYSVFTL